MARILPIGIGIWSVTQAPTMISSFDQNPANGIIPALANEAARNVQNVTGIQRRSPPIRWMFCSSCMPWMTLPAPRKRQPLKKAWVTRWKMAGMKAPTPAPIAM